MNIFTDLLCKSYLLPTDWLHLTDRLVDYCIWLTNTSVLLYESDWLNDKLLTEWMTQCERLLDLTDWQHLQDWVHLHDWLHCNKNNKRKIGKTNHLIDFHYYCIWLAKTYVWITKSEWLNEWLHVKDCLDLTYWLHHQDWDHLHDWPHLTDWLTTSIWITAFDCLTTSDWLTISDFLCYIK